MWIDRQVTDSVLRDLGSFPVVVLTGPRQVGKTSLTERIFPGHRYVSLDAGAHAEMAQTRPEEFLARYPAPAIYDEVQHAPALFRHIKALVDSRRGENGLFVLTGSQSLPLMRSVSDSLAGRAAVIPLLGLSAGEWASVAADSPDFAGFAWRGSFPALWCHDPPPSRDRWYQSYVATYLERDVRSLLNVGNLRDFERFIRACAARVAQTLNMSEIGRDVGVSTQTARNWTSVLEASGQIALLEPYHRSLGKRLAKSPKLYFTDTALAAFLSGHADADAMWRSPQAGALFENHVVSQWLRWRNWVEPSAGLWYWRDQGGNEVDLLVERGGRLWAIECKLTERPSPRDARGIGRLRSFYGDDAVAGAFVACTASAPHGIAPGVAAVPGWDVFALGKDGAP
jgi:hypothetical protein